MPTSWPLFKFSTSLSSIRLAWPILINCVKPLDLQICQCVSVKIKRKIPHDDWHTSFEVNLPKHGRILGQLKSSDERFDVLNTIFVCLIHQSNMWTATISRWLDTHHNIFFYKKSAPTATYMSLWCIANRLRSEYSLVSVLSLNFFFEFINSKIHTLICYMGW